VKKNIRRPDDAESFRILVVDDEAPTRGVLLSALREHSYLCSEADSIERARIIIVKARPDLVVLDLSFPGEDGIDFLRELRQEDDLPVIVCTGRADELDRIKGLDLGADDYITKPFFPNELATRVKAVLRRSGNTPVRGKLVFGEVLIQLNTREVTKSGTLIKLTSREFDLLVYLAKHPRMVFSREALLKAIWSQKGTRTNATVTEHIRRLRAKIEADPNKPAHLIAVRGVGYRLLP